MTKEVTYDSTNQVDVIKGHPAEGLIPHLLMIYQRTRVHAFLKN